MSQCNPQSQSADTQLDDRIALVDIGSNSIRLVVYDGLKRSPEILFNEKVLCGLGRSLKATGRLHPEGVDLAFRNLVRFTGLARAMGVKDRILLATAAVREAEDAQDFIDRIEAMTGEKVTVISGKEEARLSGLGVTAGTPDADGIMGDLGGGSLELVELRDGRIGNSATLGLGTLKLMDMARGAAGADLVQAEIAKALDQIEWLGDARGRGFYPVGGTWRNLARLSLAQQSHPLGVVHGYRLAAGDAVALTSLLAQQHADSLKRVKDLSSLRLKAVPFGAALLNELLLRSGCSDVIFSACGLREGYIFDRLDREEQLKDPLLLMAAQMGRREARFGDLGEALVDWTNDVILQATPEITRLRKAACYLSDILWRETTDYRARQAFERMLEHPFMGIDHGGRLFLAFTLLCRYDGNVRKYADWNRTGLLSEEGLYQAQLLGNALRLAYRVSGAIPELLKRCRLSRSETEFTLHLPEDGSLPDGLAVRKIFSRLNGLIKKAREKKIA